MGDIEAGTPEEIYHEVVRLTDEWISVIDGSFTARDLWAQYNLSTRLAKQYLTHVLAERVKQGVLERAGQRYRRVNQDLEELDWQSADENLCIDLQWPFHLEQWIKVYPGTVAVVAGEPGSGKTAFFYEFILRNMFSPRGVNLYSNDMGKEEMKARFNAIAACAADKEGNPAGITIPKPAPFRVYERISDFGDVVKPGAINVIDYLDLNTEVYLVGQQIDSIQSHIGDGMALVGIQKKAGQRLGIGGVFGIKRPKLYITLDKVRDPLLLEMGWTGKLTIEKSRGRAHGDVNPTGMEWYYRLEAGARFIVENKGDRVGPQPVPKRYPPKQVEIPVI